jgi:hypothetical protein
MTKISERTAPKREVLLVGPYGVLGTGVLDAAVADPSWRVTTDEALSSLFSDLGPSIVPVAGSCGAVPETNTKPAALTA